MTDIQFVRKINPDWTIRSYCSRCFATIADAGPSSARVKDAEDSHKCDPRLLEMVEKYRKISHLVSAA